MAQETYQLAGSAAQVYEDQKVNAIFGPLARVTLDALPLRQGDRCLDAACGTGIVARTVHERYGTDVAVTGSDLNTGMIEVARTLTSGLTPPIEWVVADATDMPFSNNAFSVCICQQGMQFIPDKAAAVAEFMRVLEPEGRLAISVWDGVSAFFVAMAEALRRHVGDAVAEQSLAPFSFDGAAVLPQLIAGEGFRSVDIQPISIDRIIDQPETAIPKEIFGNPVGPKVKQKGDEILGKIVADIIADCAIYDVAGTLVVPQRAHLITAISTA